MMKRFRGNRKFQLVIFIVIALMSGWLGVMLDAMLPEQPEGNSLGMGLFLVLPLAAALVLRLLARDWKGFGINPYFIKQIRWYGISLVIYPLVTILTFGGAWLFGLIQLSHFDMLLFLSIALPAFAGSFVKNIFEEFSWRGYLTPMLIELKFNDWFIYLISGVVWALWHVPYYLVFLPDEVFESSLSRPGYIWSGLIIMTCWTIMYVELYRLTKSVWPGVLMHAVEDAFPTVLVTTGIIVIMTNPGDLLFNPTYGVIATLLFVGIGLALRAVRRKKEMNGNVDSVA